MADERIGSSFAHYRIDSKIGAGVGARGENYSQRLSPDGQKVAMTTVDKQGLFGDQKRFPYSNHSSKRNMLGSLLMAAGSLSFRTNPGAKKSMSHALKTRARNGAFRRPAAEAPDGMEMGKNFSIFHRIRN
jgi:hypothetical protein